MALEVALQPLGFHPELEKPRTYGRAFHVADARDAEEASRVGMEVLTRAFRFPRSAPLILTVRLAGTPLATGTSPAPGAAQSGDGGWKVYRSSRRNRPLSGAYWTFFTLVSVLPTLGVVAYASAAGPAFQLGLAALPFLAGFPLVMLSALFLLRRATEGHTMSTYSGPGLHEMGIETAHSVARGDARSGFWFFLTLVFLLPGLEALEYGLGRGNAAIAGLGLVLTVGAIPMVLLIVVLLRRRWQARGEPGPPG